jgi:toxin ParE1/3/4
MSTNYRIKAKAQKDLDEIFLYTRKNYGLDKAEIYVQNILNTFKILGDEPAMAPLDDELSKDLRKFPIQKHIVFYRIRKNYIDIIRVLHQKMDIKSKIE